MAKLELCTLDKIRRLGPLFGARRRERQCNVGDCKGNVAECAGPATESASLLKHNDFCAGITY